MNNCLDLGDLCAMFILDSQRGQFSFAYSYVTSPPSLTTGHWFVQFYSPHWYVCDIFTCTCQDMQSPNCLCTYSVNFISFCFISYSSGHCKALSPAWSHMADILKGTVNVAVV